MNDMEVFKNRAFILLEEIETNLMRLKENHDDAERLTALSRDLRTITASGVMFGLDRVSSFSQKMEHAVNAARNSGQAIADDFCNTMLSCRDHLQILIEYPDDETELIRRLGEEKVEKLSQFLYSSTPLSSGPSARQNCWEYFQCGKEKECPAGFLDIFSGMNSGQYGGRICWVITGTYCGTKKQGAYNEKFQEKCQKCEFRHLVKREEGQNLAKSSEIYQILRQFSH